MVMIEREVLVRIPRRRLLLLRADDLSSLLPASAGHKSNGRRKGGGGNRKPNKSAAKNSDDTVKSDGIAASNSNDGQTEDGALVVAAEADLLPSAANHSPSPSLTKPRREGGGGYLLSQCFLLDSFFSKVLAPYYDRLLSPSCPSTDMHGGADGANLPPRDVMAIDLTSIFPSSVSIEKEWPILSKCLERHFPLLKLATESACDSFSLYSASNVESAHASTATTTVSLINHRYHVNDAKVMAFLFESRNWLSFASSSPPPLRSGEKNGKKGQSQGGVGGVVMAQLKARLASALTLGGASSFITEQKGRLSQASDITGGKERASSSSASPNTESLSALCHHKNNQNTKNNRAAGGDDLFDGRKGEACEEDSIITSLFLSEEDANRLAECILLLKKDFIDVTILKGIVVVGGGGANNKQHQQRKDAAALLSVKECREWVATRASERWLELNMMASKGGLAWLAKIDTVSSQPLCNNGGGAVAVVSGGGGLSAAASSASPSPPPPIVVRIQRHLLQTVGLALLSDLVVDVCLDHPMLVNTKEWCARRGIVYSGSPQSVFVMKRIPTSTASPSLPLFPPATMRSLSSSSPSSSSPSSPSDFAFATLTYASVLKRAIKRLPKDVRGVYLRLLRCITMTMDGDAASAADRLRRFGAKSSNDDGENNEHQFSSDDDADNLGDDDDADDLSPPLLNALEVASSPLSFFLRVLSEACSTGAVTQSCFHAPNRKAGSEAQARWVDGIKGRLHVMVRSTCASGSQGSVGDVSGLVKMLVHALSSASSSVPAPQYLEATSSLPKKREGEKAGREESLLQGIFLDAVAVLLAARHRCYLRPFWDEGVGGDESDGQPSSCIRGIVAGMADPLVTKCFGIVCAALPATVMEQSTPPPSHPPASDDAGAGNGRDRLFTFSHAVSVEEKARQLAELVKVAIAA